jgi:hypothetical protein
MSQWVPYSGIRTVKRARLTIARSQRAIAAERDAMTDETMTDQADELAPIDDGVTACEPWTATMMADAIDVDPKAFRSFVRALVRKRGGVIGADTPGSGGRYKFDVPTDDAERAAYLDAVRASYSTHRRTNNTRTIGADVFGV